jgi:hypothetical protein
MAAGVVLATVPEAASTITGWEVLAVAAIHQAVVETVLIASDRRLKAAADSGKSGDSPEDPGRSIERGLGSESWYRHRKYLLSTGREW